MGMDSEAPLLHDSSKLLSRVSYLLADQVRTQVCNRLFPGKSEGMTAEALKIECEKPHEIKCTFEIPSKVGKETIISLFLYDVHEDTALRHSAMPTWRAQYPRSAGKRPIRLCYLVTCWFGDESNATPYNEKYAMRFSDALLTALISLRGQPLMPDAFCRILPPSEKLFSFGQFWQSLEDSRPRLTMGLTITVPYAPANLPNEVKAPVAVKKTDVNVVPVTDGALHQGDDHAERIVRLLSSLAKTNVLNLQDSLFETERALIYAMSEEAKRWLDPHAHPSLLSLREITLETARDFENLKGCIASSAASVRWCRGGNAADALPLDAAVRHGLTQRFTVSDKTINDAVDALNAAAESSWKAWCKKSQVFRMANNSENLSARDMMALAGVFGCVALAHRLEEGEGDDVPLAPGQEKT